MVVGLSLVDDEEGTGNRVNEEEAETAVVGGIEIGIWLKMLANFSCFFFFL